MSSTIKSIFFYPPGTDPFSYAVGVGGVTHIEEQDSLGRATQRYDVLGGTPCESYPIAVVRGLPAVVSYVATDAPGLPPYAPPLKGLDKAKAAAFVEAEEAADESVEYSGGYCDGTINGACNGNCDNSCTGLTCIANAVKAADALFAPGRVKDIK